MEKSKKKLYEEERGECGRQPGIFRFIFRGDWNIYSNKILDTENIILTNFPKFVII